MKALLDELLAWTAAVDATQQRLVTRRAAALDLAFAFTVAEAAPLPAPAPGAAPPAASVKPFRVVRNNSRHATLRQALAVCTDNDVIKVAGGSYVVSDIDSPGSTYCGTHGIGIPNLTIEWETPGVPAIFDQSACAKANNLIGGSMPAFQVGPGSRNFTLRGIHSKGHRSGDHQTAFVYTYQGYPQTGAAGPLAAVTVEYCKAVQYTNGIITNSNHNLTVSVRNSVFEDCTANSLSHAVYCSVIAFLDVLGCTFKTTAASAIDPANAGHLIKSRAKRTRVRGSNFDPAGGCHTCIDACNGGQLEVWGNTLHHYGVTSGWADENPPIKYGEEQQPAFNASSPSFNKGTDNFAHDSRTHSLALGQNTIWKHQFPAGNTWRLLAISAPVNESDAAMAVATTVRNNIVAARNTGTSPTNSAALEFVRLYPDNTAVAFTDIGANGMYRGVPIAGSPAVNDAAYAWGGELQAAVARSDTDRGGRATKSARVPAWVTSNLMTYAPIPGTVMSDYLKNDGSGIANALPASDPATGAAGGEYRQILAYGGYAPDNANRRMWIFGGGHAATVVANILAYVDLSLDRPAFGVACQPSPYAIHLASWQGGLSRYTGYGFLPDGKPRSPHAYRNNQVLEGVNEFVAVSLSGVHCPEINNTLYRDVAGFPIGGTAWRPAPNEKNPSLAPYWPQLPGVATNPTDMLCFRSFDRRDVYYVAHDNTFALRKLTASNRSITQIGSTAVDYIQNSRGAASGPTQALIVGGGSGGNAGLDAWRCRLINLTTGVVTPVSVKGMPIPAGQWWDLVWVSELNVWVGWYVALGGPNNAAIISQAVIKLEISGPTQLTATDLKPSGSGLPNTGGCYRGMACFNFGNGPVLVFSGASNVEFVQLRLANAE